MAQKVQTIIEGRNGYDGKYFVKVKPLDPANHCQGCALHSGKDANGNCDCNKSYLTNGSKADCRNAMFAEITEAQYLAIAKFNAEHATCDKCMRCHNVLQHTKRGSLKLGHECLHTNTTVRCKDKACGMFDAWL